MTDPSPDPPDHPRAATPSSAGEAAIEPPPAVVRAATAKTAEMPPAFAAKPAAKPAATATPHAPAAPDPNAAPPSHSGRSSALPVLTAIGFIFVLLAIAWVWNSELDLNQRLANLPPPPPPPPRGVEPAQMAALEGRVNGLEQRLTTLENRPPPAPAAAPAPAPAPALGTDSAAALVAQMATLEARLKTAEQREGKLAEQAATAQLAQRTLAALDAGEPLGDLPGAPPALARFAHAKPPTEAALRLAFPAAAAAALQASRPSADGKSLGERILMHASSLVTVKQGSKVLVGAPAATILGEAQERLDAGDLAGAVAALDALDSAAAGAMAGWRADAQALLDARAALARLAHG